MNWLQVLGPSLLMVLGGIITWFLKSRVEELQIENRDRYLLKVQPIAEADGVLRHSLARR